MDETEGQRDRGTEGQRDRGTEGQRDRGALQLPWQAASLNIALDLRKRQMRKGRSIERPFLMWSV
ncbi:hypothetical protein C7K70_00650 [Aeromonas hydrophila]|nr:hypothetical protein C7K70_00650 [Aeromonas hydrophila]